MFYCTKCAKANEWPETGFKSYGKCEVCTTITECSDMPSYRLAEIKKDEKPNG